MVRGLAGSDTLYGYDGNDTLDGGTGNDEMNGADGNDTYIVAGNDVIFDNGGTDRILLPGGVTAAGLTLIRGDSGDLQISWNGGSVIIDQALDLARAVETLVFVGGTARSLTSFTWKPGATGLMTRSAATARNWDRATTSFAVSTATIRFMAMTETTR